MKKGKEREREEGRRERGREEVGRKKKEEGGRKEKDGKTNTIRFRSTFNLSVHSQLLSLSLS